MQTHSLTRSLTQALSRPLAFSLTHSHISIHLRSFTHSLIRPHLDSFSHLHVHRVTNSNERSHFPSNIHWVTQRTVFAYLLTHPHVHTSTHTPTRHDEGPLGLNPLGLISLDLNSLNQTEVSLFSLSRSI